MMMDFYGIKTKLIATVGPISANKIELCGVIGMMDFYGIKIKLIATVGLIARNKIE